MTTEKKHCPKCGGQLDKNTYQYCPHCGGNLYETKEVKQESDALFCLKSIFYIVIAAYVASISTHYLGLFFFIPVIIVCLIIHYGAKGIKKLIANRR